MSFLLTSLTTPPGSWLQALFLLVALEAPAALAFNRWWGLRRQSSADTTPTTAQQRSAHGRLALAAGLLFVLRVISLAAAVLIPAGSPDALLVLPLLERGMSALSALLLVWALVYLEGNLAADILALLVIGGLLAGMALAWVHWDNAIAAGATFYNGTTDETVWIIVSALVLALGIWRLSSRRPAGWRAGAALLAVLLLAHGLQYLFPIGGLDAPAAVRWAELVVLPLAMLLLFRRAQGAPLAAPQTIDADIVATDTQVGPGPRAAPKFGAWPVLRQLAETFLIAALVYFAIEFSSGRFRVDGPSMQPTLYAGQFVLTDKLAYRIGRPQRGDIVVVHTGDQKFVGGGLDLIKRVVGLPGETITIGGGIVFIDGRRYLEQYPLEPPHYAGSWTLGPDQYFVLGDNRNNSSDSHIWGPLTRDQLGGRALLVYWPPSAWNWVAHTPLAAASP